MKRKIIASIRNKEAQLSKLQKHIGNSAICDDIYNRVLIEKAILKKQLDDLQSEGLLYRIKNMFRKEKLICDYFKK